MFITLPCFRNVFSGDLLEVGHDFDQARKAFDQAFDQAMKKFTTIVDANQ